MKKLIALALICAAAICAAAICAALPDTDGKVPEHAKEGKTPSYPELPDTIQKKADGIYIYRY
jgi:hypothetical protein